MALSRLNLYMYIVAPLDGLCAILRVRNKKKVCMTGGALLRTTSLSGFLFSLKDFE